MNNIIKKWLPIAESCGITDNKKREIFSQYAEHHMSIENYKVDTPLSQNLLPIALRVISKINLENKQFIISENADNVLNYGVLCTFNDDSPDSVHMLEYELVEEMVKFINEKLEKYNIINVYSLASRVKKLDKFDNNIELDCRISFEDEI